MPLTRRLWLAQAGLLAANAAQASPRPPRPARLAAAWETPAGDWRIGLLGESQGRLRPLAQAEVPTRAHGLSRLPGGDLLAVARRPGDWLLRWSARDGSSRWVWAEPDRAFNGHALLSPDGRRLYTTETRLDTGEGLVGVRDAATLDKQDEWPAHGRDPHQLLWDGDGGLLVANGGISTLPESGRAKLAPERMDSSLVRLEARRGELQGQWRLPDARLSLRHLAWAGQGARRVLGIALQAEHDDAAARQAAPVLALFDGAMLRSVDAPLPLAGYGGDIAAFAGGFAVSCPRAGGIARFGADGRWSGWLPLAEACPLAPPIKAADARLWVGGRGQALQLSGASPGTPATTHPLAALRLDNHWLAW
ncbi:DUF1513 domain-containing protein [Ramlibacter tataouinensis]|uniref:DUF1513 domain-containing protein n=1 Tax=Ramlibacter tataouinensis (strain ATCC BAA-407 / DSM 14655 / LMG 21543 / TTB310) TaxID=365046 RepID=F5Y1U4_RAMTT|nr:DUF1513 domain-containing protein [Ramlibacter tataouinensis]AEG93528.1 Conserved hypothetical protein [Ramlibacter tataouinensis TTB310]